MNSFDAKNLQEFIKTIKNSDDRERFKLENSVLMAITHITFTKSDNKEANIGVTKDEVLDCINKFDIKVEEFKSKKKKYTEQDVRDICLAVFQLMMHGLIQMDEKDINYVHLTNLGASVGASIIDTLKPLEYTVVYKYYHDAVSTQSNLRNN